MWGYCAHVSKNVTSEWVICMPSTYFEPLHLAKYPNMFASENKNPACLEIPEKPDKIIVKQSNWKQSRRAKKVRAKNFPDLISLQLVE